MSISDFEQSLWELALLINPTHLANITTSKLNSYYQDTILDMRKVVLVQNLFNDIYNNWTDHQIRYQQNRRRQIENGEITEQQLLEEENESEIEYISDEDQETLIDDERYGMEFAQPEIEMDIDENKENVDTNNNIIVGSDNTVIQLPVRKDSVSHKSNGKPIKKPAEVQPVVENKTIEPVAVEQATASKSSKDMVENTKLEPKSSSKDNAPSKEMKKKYSKSENKEQKPTENKEPVKKITLDFSSKDAAKAEEAKKSSESSNVSEEKETQKKSKKEHRRKKVEREPRKDSLKANVNLSDEKSNEVIKELQKSGVLAKASSTEEKKSQKSYAKTDSAVSLDEKAESSVATTTTTNSSGTLGNSFVIRSFNIPSQNKTETEGTSSSPSPNTKVISIKQEPVPARKSSAAAVPPPISKKNYKLSDTDISIKDKYKLDKSKEEKETKPTKTVKSTKTVKPAKPAGSTVPDNVHLRPDAGMPPTIQRRSMDELLFQFADVMDIVSLIPHIVGDDDLLGNDLTFNSSDLNSKVQTKDSNGNVVEETPRRRPSRAPTPPPTVVSNGKEYEVYSIPSERHQKYIKKKEEMEKSNKRRSSLKFEYHEFEELRKQQELAGYDTTGDVPVTERKKENVSSSRSSNKSISKSSSTSKPSSSNMSKSSSSSKYSTSSSKSSSSSHKKSNGDSNTNSCGSTMKMDVLSTCMNYANPNDNHSSSSKSSGKRSSRFFNLTKSKSKAREKEKEKMAKENKENISSNSSKNYLVRRKSNEKISSRSHRYKLGSSSPESSPSQPSPTLSTVSSSSAGSRSSGVRKSYSSTTLSKYDLPHMTALSTEGSSRRYGSSSERERSSTKQSTIPTSKSSPGLFEGIDFSAPLSTPSSSSSSKHNLKKATEQRSSSTSEIDKFFDNVFRIDWTL